MGLGGAAAPWRPEPLAAAGSERYGLRRRHDRARRHRWGRACARHRTPRQIAARLGPGVRRRAAGRTSASPARDAGTAAPLCSPQEPRPLRAPGRPAAWDGRANRAGRNGATPPATDSPRRAGGQQGRARPARLRELRCPRPPRRRRRTPLRLRPCRRNPRRRVHPGHAAGGGARFPWLPRLLAPRRHRPRSALPAAAPVPRPAGPLLVSAGSDVSSVALPRPPRPRPRRRERVEGALRGELIAGRACGAQGIAGVEGQDDFAERPAPWAALPATARYASASVAATSWSPEPRRRGLLSRSSPRCGGVACGLASRMLVAAVSVGAALSAAALALRRPDRRRGAVVSFCRCAVRRSGYLWCQGIGVHCPPSFVKQRAPKKYNTGACMGRSPRGGCPRLSLRTPA